MKKTTLLLSLIVLLIIGCSDNKNEVKKLGADAPKRNFDAPAKGTYDFICSFPGHWATMQGKFIVE